MKCHISQFKCLCSKVVMLQSWVQRTAKICVGDSAWDSYNSAKFYPYRIRGFFSAHEWLHIVAAKVDPAICRLSSVCVIANSHLTWPDGFDANLVKRRDCVSFLDHLRPACSIQSTGNGDRRCVYSWFHGNGTLVERRSLAGKISMSCARPAADGWHLCG